MITKLLQQMPGICLVTADHFCHGIFHLALIPIKSQKKAQQEPEKAGHKQPMRIDLVSVGVLVYYSLYTR